MTYPNIKMLGSEFFVGNEYVVTFRNRTLELVCTSKGEKWARFRDDQGNELNLVNVFGWLSDSKANMVVDVKLVEDEPYGEEYEENYYCYDYMQD